MYGRLKFRACKRTEEVVLLGGKHTQTRECIAHGRIVCTYKLRQELVADAVASCVHHIVRHIVARHQSPLSCILLDLCTRDSKERPQMPTVPFPHCRKPRRSRAAQDAHEYRLRKIIRMVCEDERVTAALRLHAMEEVIPTDTSSRLRRESMCTRIDGHIACAADERNFPCPTELLYKLRIRKGIRAAHPVFVVCADDLCPARRPQDVQGIQKSKRIRPAGTGNKECTRRAEKIMRTQNTFHKFLHNQLHEKGHSKRSALCYPHIDRCAARTVPLASAHPCFSRGANRVRRAWNPSCGADP